MKFTNQRQNKKIISLQSKHQWKDQRILISSKQKSHGIVTLGWPWMPPVRAQF